MRWSTSSSNGDWVEHHASTVLPELDVLWLLTFLDITPQSAAVRAVRDAVRDRRR
jgi:hypothetical protein